MKNFITMVGLGVALLSSPARASDDMIEGAKLCTSHLAHYEREYGIPTHLLSAIASTESGRYHEGLKIRIPWPWTINAEGKGYIFDSKAQAIAAVKRLKAHGVESIDIGCMQVNIYHHPDAFASLDEAFEPKANIAYAAGFLRSLYDQDGTWKQAASDYHSKTPTRGKKYVSEVYNSWYQIIDKLRAARLQVADNSAPDAAKPKAPVQMAAAKIQRVDDKKNVKLAMYHPTRENSVHLSKPNNSDVVIVKPQIKVANDSFIKPVKVTPYTTPLIKVAQAKQVPLTLDEIAPAAGGNANALGNSDQNIKETSVVTSRKNGPNFIFND